jgi:hypothetical protein
MIFLYLNGFRKSVEEIRFFKHRRITGTLHGRPLCIYDNLLQSALQPLVAFWPAQLSLSIHSRGF